LESRPVRATDALNIRHQEQLLCPERRRDGSGSVVSIYVERAPVRILEVTPDWRDYRQITGVEQKPQQM
jgi:hypothetical protein